MISEQTASTNDFYPEKHSAETPLESSVLQIVSALQERYGSSWQFTVAAIDYTADRVVVVGKLSAGASIKMAFGSAECRRRARSNQQKIRLEAVRIAKMNALKNAASLLGIGEPDREDAARQ